MAERSAEREPLVREGGEERTFAFSYAAILRPLFYVMGMSPAHTRVVLRADDLAVQFGVNGWGFKAAVPLRLITAVERDDAWVTGAGVHGNFSGTWLVNGGNTGMVRVLCAPGATARVCGFTCSLRNLRMSLERPDEFMTCLRSATAGRGREQ
jgi:hypothetical protein